LDSCGFQKPFLAAQDVSILTLIDQLTFIKDKTHWGAPFRFGTLQIPEEDSRFMASKMVNDQNLEQNPSFLMA